jgi:hypothetical protein
MNNKSSIVVLSSFLAIVLILVISLIFKCQDSYKFLIIIKIKNIRLFIDYIIIYSLSPTLCAYFLLPKATNSATTP